MKEYRVNQNTKRRLIRIGAALAAALVILWLLKQVESVTVLVLVSFFVAYLLDPGVDRLAAWKLPRSVAAFLILLAVLLFLVLLIVIIVPSILSELFDLFGLIFSFASSYSSTLDIIQARTGLPS